MPPGRRGRRPSMGRLPSLSGIRASSTLMPTLSTVISKRPPAWPTMRILSSSRPSARFTIASTDLWNTVGISRMSTSAPAIVRGRSFTASKAGLTGSPPKGSKPVTSTFMMGSSFRPPPVSLPAPIWFYPPVLKRSPRVTPVGRSWSRMVRMAAWRVVRIWSGL